MAAQANGIHPTNPQEHTIKSANYDIVAQNHSSFNFHIEYYKKDGNAVDLTGYTAQLRVIPNANQLYSYLEVSTGGVTGGGVTGEFLAGVVGKSGVGGSGGIYMNQNEAGSGSLTGGILISVDATTMSYIPQGRWLYELDLINNDTVQELMIGAFTVTARV